MELEDKIQNDVSEAVQALFTAGIEKLSPELTNISVQVKYYPIIIEGETGFIATGVKGNKKGIAKFQDEGGTEIVIYDSVSKDVYFLTADQLRDIMKSGGEEKFKRNIGWDFKTMGIEFDRLTFIELLENYYNKENV